MVEHCDPVPIERCRLTCNRGYMQAAEEAARDSTFMATYNALK